ncbi:hypothetical protein TrLO_g13441 [Triparma laevis f. longispina]|uniref:Uncharacterized protein n=2 Tax=Triparma laevis TaxID=1534972 RepID=A0A9W7FUQ6_9STRA|nr:hypothetical protein TrLO_g13441 [Triparma laevis f. longispina]
MWGNLTSIASQIEKNLNESVGIAPSSLLPREYDSVSVPPPPTPSAEPEVEPTADDDAVNSQLSNSPSNHSSPSTPNPQPPAPPTPTATPAPQTPQPDPTPTPTPTPTKPLTPATPLNNNSSVTAEVVQLRSEGQSLMLKLTKLQTSYRSLASVNKKLKEDLEKNVDQCNDKDSLIENLKNDKSEDESNQKSNLLIIQQLREEVKSLKSKREIDGKTKVDELEAELRKKESDLTDLRSSYEVINTKLNTNNISQLATEKSLRDKFSKLETKLKSEYEGRRSQIQSEVKMEYKSKETELRSQLSTSSSLLTSRSDQISKLKTNVDRLQNALKQKDVLFEQIEKSMRDWGEKERKAKEELEMEKGEKSKIQTLLDKNIKSSNQVEFVFKKRLEEAASISQTLQTQNTNLQTQISSLQKQQTLKSSQKPKTTPVKNDHVNNANVDNLTSPVGGMVGGIMLRNEINEKNNEITFLKNRVEELEELSAKKETSEGLTQKLREKEIELEEVKGDLDDVKQCYGREVHRLTMILANEPESSTQDNKTPRKIVVEVPVVEEKSQDVNDFRLGMFVD